MSSNITRQNNDGKVFYLNFLSSFKLAMNPQEWLKTCELNNKAKQKLGTVY
jgi:hypothetical protein